MHQIKCRVGSNIREIKECHLRSFGHVLEDWEQPHTKSSMTASTRNSKRPARTLNEIVRSNIPILCSTKSKLRLRREKELKMLTLNRSWSKVSIMMGTSVKCRQIKECVHFIKFLLVLRGFFMR